MKSLLIIACSAGLLMAGVGCGNGDGGGFDAQAETLSDVPEDGGQELGEDVPEEVFVDPGPPPCLDWNGNPWGTAVDHTFVRGPYLQSVYPHSAVVVWRTDQLGGEEGCVHFEVGGVKDVACVQPKAFGTYHQYEVSLTDLPPDTEVPYRVTVEPDLETVDLSFKTAPGDDRAVRMLVLADGHNNATVLAAVADSAVADGTDLAVAVGDNVGSAEEWEWDQYFEGLRALLHKVPMWPVLGNHEARRQTYFDAFVLPGASPDPPEEIYYSVRWGSVWLGVLEIIDFDVAYWLGTETPQVTWLKEQLSGDEARDARWRFLFIHEPPWSVGWGHCDAPEYYGEKALREVLVPLAADYGVTAIFSGHMHGYAHGQKDGVDLFICGGAGGGLDHECPQPPAEEGLPDPWMEVYEHHRLRVDAGCDLLVVEALALDGEETVIDRVEIPYKEPPPL